MERISKNYIKGALVTSIAELIDLANQGKAVYHFNWKIKPAAFIISMQIRIIDNNIKKGYFFNIIRKPEDVLENIE